MTATTSISQFSIGDRFEHGLLMTADRMRAFAELSGDRNALHMEPHFARENGFESIVVYGNLLGLMVSTLVGMNLPTNKVMIIKQAIDFRAPVYVDDQVDLVASVSKVHEAVAVVQLDLDFAVDGRRVATGTCVLKCL